MDRATAHKKGSSAISSRSPDTRLLASCSARSVSAHRASIMTAHPALSSGAPIIPWTSKSSRLNPSEDSEVTVEEGVVDDEVTDVWAASRTTGIVPAPPCFAVFLEEVVFEVDGDEGERNEVEIIETFRNDSSFSNSMGARDSRE